MSSGNLARSTHPELFLWSPDLDPADYQLATYRISAVCSAEAAAMGMAMEQSAATVSIAGFVSPEPMKSWTIRVRSINKAEAPALNELPAYSLSTEVYPSPAPGSNSRDRWDVELAIPRRLLRGRPSQLLNVVVGEIPRLGFLTSFELIDASLASFGPGPSFGVQGIRARLDNLKGPLLCRSMRPAVGLDTATMARLNREVLTGGFHLVKDDELACFADEAAFKEHLLAMLRARDEARERSGEKKLYLANLICEPWELEPRLDLALELGVDGVLVAPFIQGLGVLPRVARENRLLLLAHNTFSDLLSRNANWGISEAVLCGWLRQLGADWFVTPGPFSSPHYPRSLARDLLQVASRPIDGVKPIMPILQGGKNPAGLAEYRAAMGGSDFMLIVASWVDGHADGLGKAAGLFREAVDA